MRARPLVYVLAWLWAITLAIAAFWGEFSPTEFPIPGIRQFSTAPYRVPMAAFVGLSALWLSSPSLITQVRLAWFSNLAVLCGLLGFIALSVPFGLACFSLASIARNSKWSPQEIKSTAHSS